MQRKYEKKRINKDAWLNTYADMITLILVFFVLLYSMSTIDKEKFKILVRAFTADPKTIEQLEIEEEGKKGGLGEGIGDDEEGIGAGMDLEDIEDLDDLYLYLKNYVASNNLQGTVQVLKGEDIVSVRFTSTLFFLADRAILKDDGKQILDFVGQALSEVEDHVELIRIDGHTAEAAPGTSLVDDRELSTDRANEVLKYLEDRYIKDPSKLIAVGYGMYRPVAPNDSEENRAKNRRVEILVSKDDKLKDELDKINDLSDGTQDNND